MKLQLVLLLLFRIMNIGPREKSIIVILDESENMNKDELDKIKRFTTTLGMVSSDLEITMWKFGTDTENVFSAQPLSFMQTYINYEPSGKASLFDSIYNVIAGEYDKENVLCLVSTAGIDDSSVECDLDIIQGTIEEMEKEKGWVFVFINSDPRIENYEETTTPQMKYIKHERKLAWKKIAEKFKGDTEE